MKFFYIFLFALSFLTMAVFANNGNSNTKSLESILNSDGTLDLSKAKNGSYSTAGLQMVLGQGEEPSFLKAGTNTCWSDPFLAKEGIGGSVYAVCVIGSRVYVGGNFTNAGGNADADYIAYWYNNKWNALSTGTSNLVYALETDGTNLFVGGAFTLAGGVVNTKYIAKWNGSAWSAIGTGVNNTVYALEYSSTALYVGGAFTDKGNYIAKITPADNVWLTVNSGTNGIVYSLCEVGLYMYLGGSFTTAGGISANYFARVPLSGAPTYSFFGPNTLNNIVRAIAFNGTNVAVGGDFTNSGTAYACIVNSGSYTAFGSGIPTGGKVYSIVDDGTNFVISGAFSNAGGNTACDQIGVWNGTSWTALENGFNSTVRSVFVAGTGLYYAGGDFDLATTYGAKIAKYNGTAWEPIGVSVPGLIYSIVYDDTCVYVGGSFTDLGGDPDADYIARWSITNSKWYSMGTGVDANVYSMALSTYLSYKYLIVGGSFNIAGGVANTATAAKWNLSTNVWSALGAGGLLATDIVYAVEAYSNYVWIGGSFTMGSNVNIAQCLNNGTTWLSNLGTGLNNTVRSILAADVNNVYVGGSFTQAGATANTNLIAKWNSTTWEALGVGLNGAVYDMKMKGSDLYVAGGFYNAGGIAAADYIAKWSGTAWSSLGATAALNDLAYSLSIDNNNIYVGGFFNDAGGDANADKVAVYNGTAWESLGSGVTLGSYVKALAYGGNNLYVGGYFTKIGDKYYEYFARYGQVPSITSQTPTADQILCEGATVSFTVTATGTGLTYQWLKDGNSIASANSSTYTIATIATSHAAVYSCRVSTSCGNAYTSPISLTVNTKPAITTHPSITTVCAGNTASFSFVATGTGISYKWQVSTNGGSTYTDITAAGTNPTYTGYYSTALGLSGILAGNNNYLYRSVASGTCSPAAISNTATLTVNTSPTITTQPLNASVCAGNTGSFTVAATGTALTYQWQVSTNGGSSYSNITAAGSNPTYSNYYTATLGLSGTTTINNGYLYRCVISGMCTPAVTSFAGSLTITTAPSVTTPPADATICAASSASFGVTAIGTALTYQWQLSINGGVTYNNITVAGTSPTYSNWTTATLSLTGTVVGNNIYKYRCVVSGTCTPTATSTAATLTVNSAMSVTTQPIASTICENANTSFSIIIAGTVSTYQWQYSTNSGSSWSNVPASGVYTGTTSSTLSITSATSSMNGYLYSCFVTGPCAISITSNATALTVNALPAISTQPGSYSVGNGGSTNFAVVAAGASISYKWQISTNGGTSYSDVANGGSYSGALTNTLSIVSITAGMDAYKYRCIVNGTCSPSATSTAGTLTVTTAPAITKQPASVSICASGNTYFRIKASGTITSYEWQYSSNGGTTWNTVSNGGIYAGATSDSLVITGASISVTGYKYHCYVVGASGNATSSDGILTINASPSISIHPSSKSACPTTSPIFGVTASGAGLSYQWEQSINSGVSWSTMSGKTASSLTVASVTSGMNGYQYHCIVSGTCSPSITSNAATLTVNTTPAIVTQPSSAAICAGQNTSFAVVATGTGASYQWYRSIDAGTSWSPISLATTATLSLTSVLETSDQTLYHSIVSGTCSPSVTSSDATLTVRKAPVVTGNPAVQNVCQAANASFTITATGNGLGYMWMQSANGGTTWSIMSGETSATLNLVSVTTGMNNNQYKCIATGTCSPNDTSNSAVLTVNAAPSVSSHPSNAAVCPGGSTSFSVIASGYSINYQWEESTNGGTIWNALGGEISSTLSRSSITPSMNTYKYRCVVSGTCSPAATSNAATLTVNTLPIVNLGPDTTFCSGLNIVINSAAGYTSYQWNTGDTTQSITTSSTGSYYVILTNSNSCTDTSSVKKVTIKESILVDEICMVSLDPDSRKNMIVWERTNNIGTNFYVIYKLQGLLFKPIDTVPFSDVSVFVDVASNPLVKAEQYKISAIDGCNIETPKSPYHQTMNLSILSGRGTSTVALIWNKYIDESGDFIPEYYYVYRGMDSTNLSAYDSLSGLLSSYNYNILDAVDGEYYQVVIRKNCAPLALHKASSGPFSQSLSNLEDNRLKGTVGVKKSTKETIRFNVYPTPYRGSTTISYNLQKTSQVKMQVLSMLGQTVTVLVDKEQGEGDYTYKFSAADYNYKAGVYYLRLEVDGKVLSRKIVEVQ